MSKKDVYKLLSIYFAMSNNINNNYSDILYDEIITDEKVNDCLTNFYFSMLSQDKTESDEQYIEFERKYLDLTNEEKELAKVEIAKILDIEYKPKIKKKERW